MRTNLIRQRVADFLERHAPFDSLSPADRLELAGSGRVKFHEAGEEILREGEAPGPVVWVVQQGQVELFAGDRLCDVAGEGDLLGLERFAGAPVHQQTARTGTDVILYGLAAPLFAGMAERYAALRQFIQARVSVAGAAGAAHRISWLEREAPPLDFLRARGTAGLDPATLPELEAPVTTRAAVREMLRARRPAVAVSMPGGGAPAVLTEADLSLFTGQQPVRLLNEIRTSGSRAELAALLAVASRAVREALAQPRDIDETCLLSSEVWSALASACIRLAAAELEEAGFESPPAPHCWVSFGGAARHDAAQTGAPTLAVIYDDRETGGLAGAYFTALAGQTAAWFDACGLRSAGSYWPKGTQPGMPLSEWKRLYSDTIGQPLLHSLWARREFLDLRALDGDPGIFEELRAHVRAELEAESMAVALLANDTLNHVPPLTFFQGLVLELDGTRRDHFDVERSVIAPLTDAARVFAMAGLRMDAVSTLERLAAAEADDPQASAVLREAADAFRIGVYYQTLAGQAHLDPARLDKVEQLLLKTALTSVQRFLAYTVKRFIPAEEGVG